jgi:hypothetical protein
MGNKGFVHESSRNESVEWYTPSSVFEALGCRFDLDVCSPGADKSFVPADFHFTAADDGLTSQWRGFVWCNPPYGRETGRWLDRMGEHRNGIALTFSRTDTTWFHKAARSADVVLFVEKRISFICGATGKPAGSPGAGSALFGWGFRAMEVLWNCDLGVKAKLR